MSLKKKSTEWHLPGLAVIATSVVVVGLGFLVWNSGRDLEQPQLKKKSKKKKSKKAKNRHQQTKATNNNSKPGSSSYYFFKSTPQDEAAKYKPREIDSVFGESPAEIRSAGPGAPSVWNNGGTWEEQSLQPFILKRIKERLEACFGKQFTCGDMKVTIGDWNVSGDGQLILIRGRKRAGFEASFSASFHGTYGDTPTRGSIEVPSVDLIESQDKDFAVQLSVSQPALGSRAYSAIKGGPKELIQTRILEMMHAFAQELKAEYEN